MNDAPTLINFRKRVRINSILILTEGTKILVISWSSFEEIKMHVKDLT